VSTEKLLARLSVMLGELLGDDSLQLTMDTIRSEVDGWDSFNYINFIVAVEMEYGVKFSIAEVEAFSNVGEIVTALQTLIDSK